jgi:hypothetical protein
MYKFSPNGRKQLLALDWGNLRESMRWSTEHFAINEFGVPHRLIVVHNTSIGAVLSASAS